MTLWAIVPVKPLRRGKSRLAGVLTEEERTFLNFTMLANTMKAIAAVPEIDQLLVISRDQGALAMARDFGARTVLEDGKSDDLNRALERATAMAMYYAANSVLVLPADLPIIDAASIQAMIRMMKTSPMLVIAPDRRREGTNGMLMSPVNLMDYRFGLNSFSRHVQEAEKHHVPVAVCELPKLALDLDLPEDLELLREMEMLQFDAQGAD